MLSFEEFCRTPQCRPLILSEEDTPQDVRQWRKIERQHRDRQYEAYVVQQNGHGVVQPSAEEKRVAQRLDQLCNNKTKPSAVVQPKASCATIKDANWWREYRKKPKPCPHCGEDVRRAP